MYFFENFENGKYNIEKLIQLIYNISTIILLFQDTCKDKSYYRCPIKCLNPEALCDGVIDCIDKSDETIAAKCGKFTTMR